VLKFASGTVGNINLSYDMWKSDLPAMQMYGTDGVLICPNPNTMSGPIKLLKADEFKAFVESKEGMIPRLGAIYGPQSFELFREIDTVAPRIGNERGLGVTDMADAILTGGKPRVSADLCRHVTEAINAFNVSVETGLPYKMTTTFEQPEAMQF